MRIDQTTPTYRMRGLADVSAGARADADAFGAGNARQLSQFGAAVQGLGEEGMRQEQAKRREHDETMALSAANQMHTAIRERGRDVYAKRGRDASAAPEEMGKLLDAERRRIEAGLENDHQRKAFSRSFDAFRTRELGRASAHRDREDEVFQRQERDAANSTISLEAADQAEFWDLPEVKSVNRARLEMIFANIDRNNAGSPDEYLALLKRAAAETFYREGVARLTDPEKALRILDDEDVKRVLPPPELAALKEKYAGAILDGARKTAENDMRRLGLELGDKYDTEYEIIDALRDVGDRELAAIARTEAETVRKARLAMGSEKASPEEKARDDRLARTRAEALLKSRDPDDSGDDITDEDGIDAALDEFLPEEPEVMREKVRKYAVAGLKAKRSRMARERRALDDKALQTMAASGWDAAAIDPSWPVDLQDRMLERAERRQALKEKREEREAEDARRARGLELLEMPLDRLNERILNGEWPDIVEEAGAGSPEYKALSARLNGDNKGGRTMLQYAKNEFAEIFGSPALKKNQKRYAKFIGRVDESRAALAAELDLDDPNLIPNPKQEEIVKHWLMDGDFRWFDWPANLSPNKRRFEVPDEDLPEWKPFDVPEVRAGPAAGALPAFARPYFGPGDKRRERLPDGGMLIEGRDGTVVVVNPDGSLSDPAEETP